MGCKITVAEFCKKYKIDRHKLNYQFRLKNIERDEDKKFDEQKMLELLQINNVPNEEIQHLNKEMALLQEKLELLTNHNKIDAEIHYLKEKLAQLNEKFENQAILIRAQKKKRTYYKYWIVSYHKPWFIDTSQNTQLGN